MLFTKEEYLLGGLEGSINWVDVLSAILLIRAIYIGSNVGLSAEIFKFTGALFSLIFSIHGYKYLAGLVTAYTWIPSPAAEAVSFVIIVFALILVFKLLRTFVGAVVNFSFVALLERYGGLLFGLARGIVAASTLLIFLSILPSEYLRSSINEHSLTGQYFVRVGINIYGLASKIYPSLNQELEIPK